MLPNSANPHCVEKIVALSEEETVIASEDIVDERGVKLWAKGKPVSRQLQERLLQRKLLRPIEASLTVENGVELSDVVAACRQAIDENELLRKIAGSRDALGILAEQTTIHLPGPLKLLLSAERKSGSPSFSHCVYTVAVCAGMAARLQLSERDASVLLLGGLLHDIGEMYVNPAYLTSAHRLAPSEWKHVASHPRVSQMLIQELTSLPAAVALGVLQHHERLNGSGYPFQAAGDVLNRAGAQLAVADSVAAIIKRGGCGCAYRAGLALRIVPEEFDPVAVQAAMGLLQDVFAVDLADADCSCIGRITEVLAQLESAQSATEALLAGAASRFTVDLARSVMAVLGNLRKAVDRSGLAEVATIVDFAGDQQVLAEVCLIVKEIGWRLRNMSRNAYLRAEAESSDALGQIAPLVACLDGSASEAKVACVPAGVPI